MLIFFQAILTATIMSDCAAFSSSSKIKYSEYLNQWRGRHLDEFMAIWGMPNGVYSNRDDNKFYRWQYQRLSHVTSLGSYQGYPRPGYGWPRYSRRVYYRCCETVITTDKGGYIQSWTYRGNGYGDIHPEEPFSPGPVPPATREKPE